MTDDPTLETYNKNAQEISTRFRAMGARTYDIDQALALVGKKSGVSVLEIGSGDGRDAAQIAQKVDSYIGIEPSIGLIEIAKKDFPGVVFIQATAQDYQFPQGLEVIFAFASLLHIDRRDLALVMRKAWESLNEGGIIYMSVKEADTYTPEMQEDAWGLRQFFLYSVDDLLDIAGEGFELVYEAHQIKPGLKKRPTKWLTLALKKVQ